MTQSHAAEGGDTVPIIEFINRRIALVDSLNEAWARRRAARPAARQIYRNRVEREHRARMDATRKGEEL
jgi:uncharacterized protein (DUF2342 family)